MKVKTTTYLSHASNIESREVHLVDYKLLSWTSDLYLVYKYIQLCKHCGYDSLIIIWPFESVVETHTITCFQSFLFFCKSNVINLKDVNNKNMYSCNAFNNNLLSFLLHIKLCYKTQSRKIHNMLMFHKINLNMLWTNLNICMQTFQST